eukprot:gene526-10209_t
MVLSWALINNGMFGGTPFSADLPINERAPNWVAYRLSKAQMLSIKAHSTHWRATCSFNTHGIDFTDYVRANLKSMDIMTYQGAGMCKNTEYINIRGKGAHHKTARFWQAGTVLHHDSYHSGDACEFGARQGSVVSEDNFGAYANTNKNFRCTANRESTTQYWFGGYI